jgi:hypothetical protein
MKNYIFTMTLLVIFGNTLAQQRAEVRLKDGVVIKGELLRVSNDKQVVIKTTSQDSMLIDWVDISYIDFALPVSNNTVNAGKPHYDFSDSTFFATFDTRFGGGQGDWGAVINPGFSLSVGKYLNRNRYFGLAASISYDYMFNLRSDFIPLGLSWRGNFRTGGLSAFYELGAGYSIPNKNGSSSEVIEKNGGVYINPSLGLISKKREHLATYVKLGYNYTSYGEKYNASLWQQGVGQTNVEVSRQYDLQSIRLSLGMYFD